MAAVDPDSAVDRAASKDWRPVVVYVVVAAAAAWLVAAPLWFNGGLASPLFPLLAGAMMFTPTMAAVVATRWGEHRPFRGRDGRVGVIATLGLVPPRPFRRWFAWLGISYLVVIAVVVAGFVVAGALGVWIPDLTNFSLFRAQLDALGVPPSVPIGTLVVAQLIQSATLVVLVNCVATAGEEIGWRGYLYPRLLARMPRIPALVLGGVIWGLWHAPVVLLGYNFGDRGPFGLLMMCGFTVVLGTILAWLAERGRSVWPAVLGHSVVNSVAPAVLLVLGDRAHQPNLVLGAPMGLAGWAVGGVVVVVALLTWPTRVSTDPAA